MISYKKGKVNHRRLVYTRRYVKIQSKAERKLVIYNERSLVPLVVT